MKGLLKKDLLFIKQQDFMIAILLVVVAVITLINATKNGSFSTGFLCGYLVMIGSVMGLMTISYDEADKGFVYLMTMPFTRKMYVTSKYIICFLAALAASVIAVALMIISNNMAESHMNFEDAAHMLIYLICASMVIAGIGIPAYLKFGAQKGVFAVLLACVIIFIGFYALVKALDLYGIDLEVLISTMGSLGKMSFSLLVMAVAGIIVLISWYLAQKVMAKKEF